MIEVRPFAGLGHADHGWLDARHHFSFADYRDPDRMNWGSIRVWNDDTIAAKSGFPSHPHSDMEIVTYVRSGAISHRDSLGNEGRTAAGDVQVMSAGSGIVHAEYNLEVEATTLFQIWIMPDGRGGEPGWGQRAFPGADRAARWVELAGGGPASVEVLPIRADAKVLATSLDAGQRVEYAADPSRHHYLVAATGRVRVNGHEAQARDGIAITGEASVEVEALEASELVLVDSR